MSGRLTTHVLDTASGLPAAGVAISVARDGSPLSEVVTDGDGRALLCTGVWFTAGRYEIVFAIGDYFGRPSRFLDLVPVHVTIDDARRNWHVPLLCSPYAYSTYRGS